MTMSNSAETNFLELLFTNLDWPQIGDAAGLQNSAAAGNLYIALHSSDPGEAGNQSTNEISYTGYARVAVARSGSGWTVSGDTVSNAGVVTFGTCTVGSATATHFSIGAEISGATEIIVSAALASSVAISTGNPVASFAIGALTATAA